MERLNSGKSILKTRFFTVRAPYLGVRAFFCPAYLSVRLAWYKFVIRFLPITNNFLHLPPFAMRPARDETTDNLVDTLKDMVAKDQLEPALEKIRVFTRKYGRIKDPDIADIEKIAISNQAQLSNLNKIRQTGQIAPEDAFSSGLGQITVNIQDLTARIEKLDKAQINAQLIKVRSHDLDKIVKLLLVSVLLCTAIHFVYSLFAFNLLKLSVSFVGATGSFLGYYNWRVGELRSSN